MPIRPFHSRSRHRFRDRVDAGRFLGGFLAHLNGVAPLVLGIPRGGMVIAVEVADMLDGEVGCVLVAKVGAPWNRELAIGAVALDGVALLDEQMIGRMGLDRVEVDVEVSRSLGELHRRQEAFGVEAPKIAGRVVVVVDDGVATGSTLRVALDYVRRLEPSRLVCAVPVGPPTTVDVLVSEVDEIVCPLQPERFRAVGEWFDKFPQNSDAEVLELLARGR